MGKLVKPQKAVKITTSFWVLLDSPSGFMSHEIYQQSLSDGSNSSCLALIAAAQSAQRLPSFSAHLRIDETPVSCCKTLVVTWKGLELLSVTFSTGPSFFLWAFETLWYHPSLAYSIITHAQEMDLPHGQVDDASKYTLHPNSHSASLCGVLYCVFRKHQQELSAKNDSH